MSLLLFLFPCIARSEDRAVFLGADAAVGSSWPKGTFPKGYTADPSLSGTMGLSAGYGFADHWMILAGAGYVHNTLKLSDSNGSSRETYSIIQQYALFNGALRFSPVRQTYIEAGAYYGLKIAGSYKSSGNAGAIAKHDQGRETSNDFGMLIGAGYVYPFGEKISLDLGVRLMYGFADVYRDNSGFKLQTVSTSLKAGVMYRTSLY